MRNSLIVWRLFQAIIEHEQDTLTLAQFYQWYICRILDSYSTAITLQFSVRLRSELPHWIIATLSHEIQPNYSLGA